jgi:hypothetical protein
MARWKWFARRDKQFDVIVPATMYRQRCGVYAPDAAPSENGPAWNGQTAILPAIRPPRPLMTPGQCSRSSDPACGAQPADSGV